MDEATQPEAQIAVVLAETRQVGKRTNIVAVVTDKGGKGWKPIVICGIIELVIALAFVVVGVVLILRSGRLQTEYLIDNGSFPIVLAVLTFITAILALIAGRRRTLCTLRTSLFFGIPMFVVLISFFSQFVLVCADFYGEPTDADAAKKTAEELERQQSPVRLTLVATETVVLGVAAIVFFVMDVYVCRKVCTCCCCCRQNPEVHFAAHQSEDEVVERAVFVVGQDGAQRVGAPPSQRAVETGSRKF